MAGAGPEWRVGRASIFKFVEYMENMLIYFTQQRGQYGGGGIRYSFRLFKGLRPFRRPLRKAWGGVVMFPVSGDRRHTSLVS